VEPYRRRHGPDNAGTFGFMPTVADAVPPGGTAIVQPRRAAARFGNVGTCLLTPLARRLSVL